MSNDKLLILEAKIDKLIAGYTLLQSENNLLKKENSDIKQKLTIFLEERSQNTVSDDRFEKENEELKIKQLRIKQELTHLLRRVTELEEK